MSDYPGQIDPLDPSGSTEVLAETAPRAQVPDRRAERDRRVRLSILTSLLIRPISFILPIVTIPLLYRYLGKERYGLYESIGALAMYLGMTNAGMNLGLINKLTDCEVKGDRIAARRYTSSLTIAMTVVMFVGIALLGLITMIVPWQRVFHTESAVATRETPWSFFFAGLVMLGGLLSGITSAIYIAYQETHRNNLWDGASKLLSLLACVLVVRTPLGIVGVILALSGVQTAVRLINLLFMFGREKPWLRPSLRMFDWSALKTTASEGILLFALQMSVVLLFQTDKLVIGIGRGPEEVAAYAIVGRVFLAAYGVYMMLLTPLWPASGEAVRRGDVAWVRKSLRISMLFGCGLMAFTGIILFFWGNFVLRLMAGGGGGSLPTASQSLILAITATFILRAWVDCRSTVLNAAGVLKPQIFAYGAHAILNIIVAILVVRRFGVEGVAWSTPITALLTSAWGYPYLIRKYITKPDKPTASAVGPATLP